VNRWLPDHFVPHVATLTPEWLGSQGIRALVCDLDNTLVPWHSLEIPDPVRGWVETLTAAGIPACIASNTLNFDRLARIADGLGMAHVPANARKPGTVGIERALALLGREAHLAAMVGDQFFTDMIAGRRAGLTTVLVNPLATREFMGTRIISRPLERLVLGDRRPTQ
jgi:HAD superfamily phosphatase (TIGR01668 family)